MVYEVRSEITRTPSRSAPGGAGRMSRQEALAVLGLAEGASADEIRAATAA